MSEENINKEINKEILSQIVEAGVVYGHKKSKTHPQMKQYISGTRNEIELIDPQAILGSLERAIQAMKEVKLKGGLILFVGTAPAAKAIVKNLAMDQKMPYVISRWLGGTLTNFKVINARTKYYEELKRKIARGELGKYTKKEQLKFEKEIKKMEEFFEGLTLFNRLPDLLFIVDAKIHKTAVREARALGIPIVAIIDTDDDPTPINYPIFGNDHGKRSIEWIVSQIITNLKANDANIAIAKANTN